MRPPRSVLGVLLLGATLSPAAVLAQAPTHAPTQAATPTPAPMPAAAIAPPPLGLEEACDPRNLQPMLSAPAKKMMDLVSELDRRISATLAEERAHEERTRAVVAPMPRGTVELLCGLGFVLVLGGALLRGRRGVALVLALAGLGSVYAAVWKLSERSAQQVAALTRAQELGACHRRILEMRTQLQHAELSKCIGDFDEVDEDLVGWISKLRTGGAVTLEEANKMHEEIRTSLH